MSRFRFELATDDDDQALRGLLANTVMPGRIAVTFRREPSFFAAAAIDGNWRQVIVGRDRDSDAVVGLACRSIRTMYVNGVARPVGYLSALRIPEPYRGAGILARGYAFLRKLHDDGRTDFYLTTIAEGNRQAIALLTSRRAGLPTYRDAGKYYTFVIPLCRRRRGKPSVPSVAVRPALRSDVHALSGFLAAEGQRRQFFPAYSAADLFGEDASFRGLQHDDVLVACRGDEIVGALGGWDQRAYRQTVVEGYSGTLRWLRRPHNGLARLLGRPGLPAPGSVLQHVMAAFPVVHDSSPDIFAALLQALLEHLSRGPHEFLLLGLHEDDPLCITARRFSMDAYVTKTYLVSWDDVGGGPPKLDGRPHYLELGCL